MEQKENKILKAVRSKEVNQLRELLRAPSLNACELNEAASAAAATTEPLYVTLLFKAGANPDVAKPCLPELITRAAGDGSFEVLRDLLAVGAEPNTQNQESVTPLCASAAQGHTACVDLLLRAGADPNGRGRFAITPLQLAAANGHASVVAVLFEAGADVTLDDPLGRGLPQFLAHRYGHEDLAEKIRDHALALRKQRADKQLRTAGWEPFEAPEGVPRLILSGTQVKDPAEVLKAATEVVDVEPIVDLPLTQFEGWLRQLNPKKLDVLRCEALDAAFPLFLNLESPEVDFLPVDPPDDREQKGVKLIRERRFAGDPHLPRARYFTVSDEHGRDFETLKYELLAYRHVPISGKIHLVDCAEPDAKDQLREFGMDLPGDQCLVLVFLPSRTHINPFLFKAGFPQRPVGQVLSVHKEYTRIEKTIDLRVPSTGRWFARFFSRLVQDISGHSRTQQKFLRCWPNRPALKSFNEILPAILTQELGGNSLTSAIGAWLRKAGVEALIYPSARNDSYLLTDNGQPIGYGGWCLVDFRGAAAVREQTFLEVDDYWPKDIRLGPGTALLPHIPPNPFRFVSLVFTEQGKSAGSFRIEQMSSTVNTLLEMELDAVENGRRLRPWWSWGNYVEKSPAPVTLQEPDPLATLNAEPSYYDGDELMRHAELLAERLDDPTIVSSARSCYEGHNLEPVSSDLPIGRAAKLESRLVEVIKAGRQRLRVEQSILSLLKARPREKGEEEKLAGYAETLGKCIDDPAIAADAQQELEDFHTAVAEARYGGMINPREPQKALNRIVDLAMERVANEIPGITKRYPTRDWSAILPDI